MLTGNGSWMSSAFSTKMPTTARRGGLPPEVTVRIRSTSVCLPRRTVIATIWPILRDDIAMETSCRLRTGLPSIATITSSGSSLPVGGHARDDLVDERAGRAQHDVLAGRAQRDGRRDLLRVLHVLQVDAPALRGRRRPAG